MKNLLVLAMFAFSLIANAQDFPKPSPMAKTYQMVGLTEIEIAYSSPGAKGREIWGDVVPFDKMWRTGANMATVVSFSTYAVFGEVEVPAGEYALFSIPSKDKIQFMLNKNTDQGGTGSYDEALTIGSVTVDLEKGNSKVERLQFTIENTTVNGADIRMSWSDRTCVIPVKVKTQSLAEENMKAKMDMFENGEFRMYNDACNYYLEAGMNKKAVEMGEKSCVLQKKFWNTHALAKAYKKIGDNENAIKMAQESLALAKAAEYQPYVKMNEEMIAELSKKK